MQLIDNFASVATRAWSVRFGAAAGVFTLLNFLQEFGLVLPYLEGVLPPKTYLVAALVCGMAGFASRFLKQNGMTDPAEAP
jgi:hypothetical protein